MIFFDAMSNIFSFRKVHFHTFTFLWIFAFITWLPYFPRDIFINEIAIAEIPAIKWMILHEQQVLLGFSLYLMLFLAVFFLLILACRTDYYKEQLTELWEFLGILGLHFMLAMQLLHNFEITQYGIYKQWKYYVTLLNENFFFFFSFLGYFFLLVLFALMIMGYFHRKKDKKQPDSLTDLPK